MLTSYNGQAITYDEIGNPLNDGTWAYTWQHGRQLASMNSEKTTLEFEYNADGIRTKKIVTTTSDHVHTFQDAVTQPKCTENGYTTHTCICGYIYQDSPVPATGHSYTASVVADTCTANGYTLYSCTCGDSYQEGAKGHTFTTLVVEPTETVNGFTLHQCECGYSYESDPVVSLASPNSNANVACNTKVYDYIYNGSSLTQLTITTNTYAIGTTVETLYFAYDGSSPMTVTYGEDIYYYVTNLQGDVVAILDATGTAVVEYSYDAWGNILDIGGSMASDLGVANPLTYRGYVYDDESGLYYLQSRYYDPELCRFINADALVSTGQGLLGNNMFAYCGNAPVSRTDSTGSSFRDALSRASVYSGSALSFDFVIYYYHPDSSKNLDEPAWRNHSDSRTIHCNVESFDELVAAINSSTECVDNIFIYMHGDDRNLTFYYDLNYDAEDIKNGVNEINIIGDIYFFSCRGGRGDLASTLASATNCTVVASMYKVSFGNGYARCGWKNYVQDVSEYGSYSWYSYYPDGNMEPYSQYYVYVS